MPSRLNGVIGVIPLMLAQAFPPAVRFSGISFSYNVAYAIFGGLTNPHLAGEHRNHHGTGPLRFCVVHGGNHGGSDDQAASLLKSDPR
jgi:hypothetical protein